MSQIDFIALIHKQLSQEITAEELNQLNDWLDESVENKMTQESISEIWRNADFNESILEDLGISINLDNEFDLLDKRIVAGIEKPLNNTVEEEIKVIPMRRKFLKFAAGIAIILGAAATWIYFSDFGAPKMVELKTGEETKEIILADGSTIKLNANSTLVYPESFEGDTREIEFSGEAFFNIAKDPAHPFTVHTPYEDVSVLGTSFNIRAYANEPNSEIVVSTGKVQVSSTHANLIILPNEKAIVDHSSGVLGTEKTESLNELSWMTNKLDFKNDYLPNVLDDIEDYYHITFNYNFSDYSKCTYNGSFNNENLETVLQSISTVLSVSITEKGNGNYTITGGICD